MNLDSIPYIPCNPSNHGGSREAGDIKYLVYHYTANDGDTARNNCIYYSNPVKPHASAHYYVDDNGVMQSVKDLISAWSVGGKKWNDCDQTGGGKRHGIVTNRNSLSIELCDCRRDGVVMATDKTLANAVELGKALMAKYNIPIERVIRHFDVTGKHCPVYFMDEDKWAAFKARLAEKEEPVNEIRYQTLEEIRKGAPWAAPTVEKLLAGKLLRGGESGKLDLSRDMLRLLVVNDRAGCYK